MGGIISASPGASIVKDIFDAGTEGNTVSQNSSSNSGINLKGPSGIEKTATDSIDGTFKELQLYLAGGAGKPEVDAAYGANQDYIKMLDEINRTGGQANANDRDLANRNTNDLFAPQELGLAQSFEDQRKQATRLAAQLGRPANDPVVLNMLAQDQTRQQAMLNANKSSYLSQELRNSPFQRLDLQGQLANAKSGLASQAMQNRMTLMNLGSSLQANERNWRLQTSDHWGTSANSQHSGGGLLGGIGAVMGVAGGAASLGSAIMGMPGGGQGATAVSQQYGGTSQMQPMGGAQFSPSGGYQSSYFGNIGGPGQQMQASPSAYASRPSRVSYGSPFGSNAGMR